MTFYSCIFHTDLFKDSEGVAWLSARGHVEGFTAETSQSLEKGSQEQ